MEGWEMMNGWTNVENQIEYHLLTVIENSTFLL